MNVLIKWRLSTTLLKYKEHWPYNARAILSTQNKIALIVGKINFLEFFPITKSLGKSRIFKSTNGKPSNISTFGLFCALGMSLRKLQKQSLIIACYRNVMITTGTKKFWKNLYPPPKKLSFLARNLNIK